MAILAIYGPCPLPLLFKLQVAALALAVKGVLQVETPGLPPGAVAVPAGSDRLPLPPGIAPALVLVMAADAGHAGSFMPGMAKGYRRLLPGTGYWNR